MPKKEWSQKALKEFWASLWRATPPLGSKFTCKRAGGTWATHWSSKDYAEMERTPAPDPK